jgi:hypothetical protein
MLLLLQQQLESNLLAFRLGQPSIYNTDECGEQVDHMLAEHGADHGPGHPANSDPDDEWAPASIAHGLPLFADRRHDRVTQRVTQ